MENLDGGQDRLTSAERGQKAVMLLVPTAPSVLLIKLIIDEITSIISLNAVFVVSDTSGLVLFV